MCHKQHEKEKDCSKHKEGLEICGISSEGTHSFPLSEFQERAWVSTENNSKVVIQGSIQEHLSPVCPHVMGDTIAPNTIRLQGIGWEDKSRSIP